MNNISVDHYEWTIEGWEAIGILLEELMPLLGEGMGAAEILKQIENGSLNVSSEAMRALGIER